jgi:hypothetical protein
MESTANSFAQTAADVESAQPGGWRREKPQLSASICHEAGRRLKNKPRMEKTCVYSVQGNMKKVATQANVSISTVSRGVNQSGYAASNVRETVLRAMKRLNYPPSAMIARGLRRRSTETIGVLVPQSAHPFFGAIGIAIEKPFGGMGRIPFRVVGGLIGTIGNGLNTLHIQTFDQLVVMGSRLLRPSQSTD